MARIHTVTTNDIAPGTAMYVRGKVAFCRIASLITGEELRKKQERLRFANRSCPAYEHTSISLTQARVLCADPNHMTAAETYATESLLFETTDPQTKEKVSRLSFDNKSKFLPRVFVKCDGEENVYDEIHLERELDKGLDVTVCFSVYNSKKGNNGVRIDCVLVNEPLDAHQKHADDLIGRLEQLGITVNSLPESDETEDDLLPDDED